MLVAEPARQRLDVDAAFVVERHVHLDLVALAQEPQVAGAGERPVAQALGRQPCRRPIGELPERLGHVAVVAGAEFGDQGPAERVAVADRVESVGREHARRRRDQHGEAAEECGEGVAVQRPRAAEGHERVVTGIQAALDGHDAQRPGHLLVGDVDDGLRCLVRAQPDARAEPAQRPLGGVAVQRDLAAQQAGRQAAQHEVGVGDGRLVAAPAVADRPRLGPGGSGADAQTAQQLRHEGDGAATGADAAHVHTR